MLQVITLSAIAVLVALDQIIKLLVIKYLKPIGILNVIDGFIRLNYDENTGAAFGSFSKYTAILSIVTSVVIVVGIVLLLSGKIRFGVEYVSITIILAGGMGNLVDRIFRGYVIDYIEPLFVDFAIFNFADILITCGAAVLIGWMLFDIYKDYKESRANKNE